MRQVIVLSELAAAKYTRVLYTYSGWTGMTPEGVEERLPHGALEAVPLDTLLAGLPQPEPQPAPAKGKKAGK